MEEKNEIKQEPLVTADQDKKIENESQANETRAVKQEKTEPETEAKQEKEKDPLLNIFYSEVS
jgi:hypothetical protein